MIIPLFFATIVAIIATFFITPYLIKRLKVRRIVAPDVHKVGKPRIPRMGGVAIVFGYLSGNLILIPFTINTWLAQQIAAISSILLIFLVGMVDDILKLRQRMKVVLPLFAAIPLVTAVSADRTLLIPFMGSVSVGLLYPLVLVPIVIITISNLTNMLAGLNGLEVGCGTIATFSILIAAVITNKPMCALIIAPLFGALIAFLYYNRYPAKILPGNSGTYVIGAAIAAAVVCGGMIVVGAISLLPQIIEFFVKASHRFSTQSFGILNPDGKLTAPEKNGSFTHILMRFGRYNESQLVRRFWILQTIAGILAIITAYFSLYYIFVRIS